MCGLTLIYWIREILWRSCFLGDACTEFTHVCVLALPSFASYSQRLLDFNGDTVLVAAARTEAHDFKFASCKTSGLSQQISGV